MSSEKKEGVFHLIPGHPSLSAGGIEIYENWGQIWAVCHWDDGSGKAISRCQTCNTESSHGCPLKGKTVGEITTIWFQRGGQSLYDLRKAKEKILGHSDYGVNNDWPCRFCGGWVRWDAYFCIHCGNGLRIKENELK